ncbi:hypothetical protein BB14905_14135 [Bacillus sp. B14905]|nr:hypothetical protein BB14905_14135 [Bacillus sp. B14905]
MFLLSESTEPSKIASLQGEPIIFIQHAQFFSVGTF